MPPPCAPLCAPRPIDQHTSDIMDCMGDLTATYQERKVRGSTQPAHFPPLSQGDKIGIKIQRAVRQATPAKNLETVTQLPPVPKS